MTYSLKYREAPDDVTDSLYGTEKPKPENLKDGKKTLMNRLVLNF